MDPHPTLDEAPTTNGEALENEPKHLIMNTLNKAYRALCSHRRIFGTFRRRTLEEYLHLEELFLECQKDLYDLNPQSEDYTLYSEEISEEFILAEYPECEPDLAALLALLQDHGEEQDKSSLLEQNGAATLTTLVRYHGEEREMPSMPDKTDASQTTAERTIQMNMEMTSENDDTTAISSPPRECSYSDTTKELTMQDTMTVDRMCTWTVRIDVIILVH
jgi:hypothetical protein